MIIDIWISRVMLGIATLEDVPTRYRVKVEEKLKELESEI